jgi:hypothetical protein
MTTLDAVDHFTVSTDREWWPVPPSPDTDMRVLLMAAAAGLSGQLADATNHQDLKAAVHHFETLLSIGICTRQQWAKEAVRVEGELMAWGHAVDAETRRIAESN